MAQSDISWFKIASFFGAALLVVFACILVGLGGNMLYSGETFNGSACIVGGLLSAAVAVLVYKNYQQKSL